MVSCGGNSDVVGCIVLYWPWAHDMQIMGNGINLQFSAMQGDTSPLEMKHISPCTG